MKEIYLIIFFSVLIACFSLQSGFLVNRVDIVDFSKESEIQEIEVFQGPDNISSSVIVMAIDLFPAHKYNLAIAFVKVLTPDISKIINLWKEFNHSPPVFLS
jgi:hypothetical protein